MASVDYILFLTADVTVTPNLNEIRDYKYVDKAELQAMFEDPCARSMMAPDSGTNSCLCSQLIHAVVQAHCARFSLWLVG